MNDVRHMARYTVQPGPVDPTHPRVELTIEHLEEA